jgi:hypothetical protein
MPVFVSGTAAITREYRIFIRFEVPANFKWSGRLMNDESVKKIPIIDLEQTRVN